MSRFVRYAKGILSERVVDLRSLSWGLRLLAILGYACVALMLGATLLLELVGSQSSVEFRSEALSTTLQVPTLAMALSALSLALGWAFVLKGASDCARRVFLPVAAIFLIQWILFAPAEGVLAPLIGLGGILLMGAVAWAHFYSRDSTRWRNLPVLEFIAWLALMLVAIVGLLFGESRQQAAVDLETALSFPQVLTAPFWILLGLEAVDAAVNLAREIVRRLRRWISAGWFGTLVIRMSDTVGSHQSCRGTSI